MNIFGKSVKKKIYSKHKSQEGGTSGEETREYNWERGHDTVGGRLLMHWG